MECRIQNSKTKLSCSWPFNCISTTHDGFYQSCPISNKSPHRVDEISPEEFFDSEYAKSVRNDLASDKPTELVKYNCNYCLSLEKQGLKSVRVPSFYELIPKIKNLVINHNGNKCNLKCLGCSPERSSNYGPLIDNWENNNFKIENLTELRDISLLGGEPFLMDSTKIILDSMPENCKISITTNGLIFPKYLTNYDTKKINILISLDGIFELDDYIRTGSNFKRKSRNIEKFIKTFQTVNFLCTFNLMNYKYLRDIVEFLKKEYGYELNEINRMIEPSFFDAINFPITFKRRHNLNFDNEFLEKEPNENDFMKGLSVLKYYDKTQKNKFYDFHPEFKSLYDDVEEIKYTSTFNDSPIPPFVTYRT